VEEEEEEEPPPLATGPTSPQHYVDETGIESEDDTLKEDDGYQEAFMRLYLDAYNKALEDFARNAIVRARIVKPLPKEKIADLTAEAVAEYAVKVLGWTRVPGSAEHLTFARKVVEPEIAGLELFLGEVKKRRWR
jgi:hypothetical protein